MKTQDKWGMISITALFFVISAPSITRSIVATPDALPTLIGTFALSLSLALIAASIRRWWILALLTPLIFRLSSDETYTAAVFHEYLNAGNIVVTYYTTGEETSSYVTNNPTAMLILLALVLLLIIAVWAKKRSRTTTPRRQLALAAILPIIAITTAGPAALQTAPPINYVMRTIEAWTFVIDKQSAISHHTATLPHTHRSTTPSERESYVLFIGESCNIDHLSIAGYPRPTTPRLARRANLTLYTDYYSNATLTMLSAPMMMSEATPETYFSAYSKPNICRIFADNGFTVIALASRNHLDVDPALTTDADTLIHLSHDHHIAHAIDSLTEIYPKTFFVAQGLGSHAYFYNFETQDNIFRPNLTSDPHAKSDSLLYNAYDCTIHYTDRVLDNIITAIDKPDMHSAILYASDHGENVAPGDILRSVSTTPKPSEYHVPMMIWRSQQWIASNPAKHRSIDENKDLPTSADNIYYTLCDLANIHSPHHHKTRRMAVTSPSLQPHKRRLLTSDLKTVITLTSPDPHTP